MLLDDSPRGHGRWAVAVVYKIGWFEGFLHASLDETAQNVGHRETKDNMSRNDDFNADSPCCFL